MIKRLELFFLARFLRYFFLIYGTFVLLYLVIDCCEKKLRVSSGLEKYALYHAFFLLLDRLSFTLYLSMLLWLSSLIYSQEAELLLLLKIPFWARIRSVFFITLSIAFIGSYFQAKYGKYVFSMRKQFRDELVYKKKQRSVIWKRIGREKLVRFLEGAADRVVLFNTEKEHPAVLFTHVTNDKNNYGDYQNADKVEDLSGVKTDVIQIKKVDCFWNLLFIVIPPLSALVVFWILLEQGIFFLYAGMSLYCIYYAGHAVLQVGDDISAGQQIWLAGWSMSLIFLYGYMFARNVWVKKIYVNLE